MHSTKTLTIEYAVQLKVLGSCNLQRLPEPSIAVANHVRKRQRRLLLVRWHILGVSSSLYYNRLLQHHGWPARRGGGLRHSGSLRGLAVTQVRLAGVREGRANLSCSSWTSVRAQRRAGLLQVPPSTSRPGALHRERWCHNPALIATTIWHCTIHLHLQSRNGAKVTLFESEPQCGGHTLTDTSSGFPVDLGFQVGAAGLGLALPQHA